MISLLLSLLISSSLAVYTDAEQFDAATSEAVNLLTEEGVVEGNPDGSFAPFSFLNRAEFMQIAMRLLPPSQVSSLTIYEPCFPDVPFGAWYEIAVCAGKRMGFVRGNAEAFVPEDEWLFAPSRRVQYEEAVKVLVKIYALPATEGYGDRWYEPYMAITNTYGLGLPGVRVGTQLTRAQMAQLTANFYSYHHQPDPVPVDPTPDPNCEPYICSDGSVHPACSSDGQTIYYFVHPCDTVLEEEEDDEPVTYDPLNDSSTRSSILLLGSTSPIMGAAKIFPSSEPLDVDQITIKLTSLPSSVDAFLVYTEDREFLGRATRDSSAGSTHFTLPISNGSLVIDHREQFSFYVRAQTKAYDSGGVSGEVIEVDQLSVEGDGVWSSSRYTEGTTEDYNAFQTARARITSVTNGGSENDTLLNGTDILIGSFRFAGERGDNGVDLAITDLTIQTEQTGSVSVSDVTMSSVGMTERHSCSFGGSVITCASIPASFGSFRSSPRTIQIFGTVSVPDASTNAWLRLKLNQNGAPGSNGAVIWTDGDASLGWVEGGTPVATSTYYSR